MAASLRPARPTDADAIQRVARAAWHAAYDPIIGAERVDATVDAWYEPDRLVADDIEPEDRAFIVAETGGSVVGFAEGVPDGDRTSLAHLYRIYVHPDRWGEGIGEALLDRVESRLRGRGFDRLQVIVLAANDRGVGFYESVGFERIGTRENDRFEIPEHEYEKAL